VEKEFEKEQIRIPFRHPSSFLVSLSDTVQPRPFSSLPTVHYQSQVHPLSVFNYPRDRTPSHSPPEGYLSHNGY